MKISISVSGIEKQCRTFILNKMLVRQNYNYLIVFKLNKTKLNRN